MVAVVTLQLDGCAGVMATLLTHHDDPKDFDRGIECGRAVFRTAVLALGQVRRPRPLRPEHHLRNFLLAWDIRVALP